MAFVRDNVTSRHLGRVTQWVSLSRFSGLCSPVVTTDFLLAGALLWLPFLPSVAGWMRVMENVFSSPSPPPLTRKQLYANQWETVESTNNVNVISFQSYNWTELFNQTLQFEYIFFFFKNFSKWTFLSLNITLNHRNNIVGQRIVNRQQHGTAQEKESRSE